MVSVTPANDCICKGEENEVSLVPNHLPTLCNNQEDIKPPLGKHEIFIHIPESMKQPNELLPT